MIYRNSGAGTPWPMLTKSNYHEWSLLMKVKLQALCATVPTELGASLANKATAKLAWESIAAARVGEDRVHQATLQRL
jgi:hypothetical protein